MHKPKITYPDYEFHEKFFIPAVFGIVEDLYNTPHTEFPLLPPRDFNPNEPEDHYGIVTHFDDRRPGK